jgi:hypothetical protein
VTPIATTPPGTPGPTCGTQVNANGGGLPQTTTHQMGVTSGTFLFHYDGLTIPDQFDVYYGGMQIFTTGVPVSNAHDVMLTFGPGQSTFIVVVVSPSTNTSNWHYTVNCPT